MKPEGDLYAEDRRTGYEKCWLQQKGAAATLLGTLLFDPAEMCGEFSPERSRCGSDEVVQRLTIYPLLQFSSP